MMTMMTTVTMILWWQCQGLQTNAAGDQKDWWQSLLCRRREAKTKGYHKHYADSDNDDNDDNDDENDGDHGDDGDGDDESKALQYPKTSLDGCQPGWE